MGDLEMCVTVLPTLNLSHVGLAVVVLAFVCLVCYTAGIRAAQNQWRNNRKDGGKLAG